MEFVDGIKITDVAGLRDGRASTPPGGALPRRRLLRADPRATASSTPIRTRATSSCSRHGGRASCSSTSASPRSCPRASARASSASRPRCCAAELDAMAEALVALGFETRARPPEALGDVARVVLRRRVSDARHGARLDPRLAARLRTRDPASASARTRSCASRPPRAGRPRARPALRREPLARGADRPAADDPPLRDGRAHERGRPAGRACDHELAGRRLARSARRALDRRAGSRYRRDQRWRRAPLRTAGPPMADDSRRGTSPSSCALGCSRGRRRGSWS